jgi:hypothetical protein
MPDNITVEGGEEVIAALIHAGKWDQSAAAMAAGERILPEVVALTRSQSGDMQRGWDVAPIDKSAEFVNVVDYWTYQEFGTESINPTYAIFDAWDSGQKEIKDAYHDEIVKQARSAGFDVPRR